MGSELTKLRHFSFDANALVLSNIKAWEGAIAVTSEEDVEAVASSRFLFYVPQGDDVDVRYLRYYFLSSRGLTQIGQASPGSADRNRTLSMKSFENIVVPLPDPPEQHRVADKLDTAMSQSVQVARMKDESTSLTLQHADALFRSIETRAPLSRALTESSDFVVVEPDMPYRTAGILNRGRGLFLRPIINGSETKYPRYNRLRKDQFVYSKLFGWEGSFAVVAEEFDGVHVSHEFPTFDIDPEVADVEYMAHLARWRGLHDSLSDQGTGMGSRRQRVNVGRLLATEVPLPDLSEQRRITKQLTLARRVADSSAAQVEQLATLRRALLDAAFSGRL
ncbi:restriction endonuclease subunit S [Streptomyces massasporeus]|uniref:restriction endonuclease subunit S n=1 Tax=Streptomyces massasporeus TaxID=67324 RepID=UPI0034075B8C